MSYSPASADECDDAQHGDAEPGDAEHGDAQHGDAQHGDAQRGDDRVSYGTDDLRGDTAVLNIQLPANASLFFNGVETTGQVGARERRYVTPLLSPGETYKFDLRAQWMENGKMVERSREVKVEVRRPHPHRLRLRRSLDADAEFRGPWSLRSGRLDVVF